LTRKILVADTPEADRRLSAILSGYDVVSVRTLEQAERAVDATRFDMVLVGVHFDESRMFDFLRHLQAKGTHGACPVACTRSYRFVSPAISVEGLEIAVRALGCKLFLDLTKYPDDAQGNAAVRQLLDALLKP
jgi:DNA-binding response OmpR family regulator